MPFGKAKPQVLPEVRVIGLLVHCVADVLGLKEVHGLEPKHQVAGFAAHLTRRVTSAPAK
jgi:hypothetical protein